MLTGIYLLGVAGFGGAMLGLARDRARVLRRRGRPAVTARGIGYVLAGAVAVAAWPIVVPVLALLFRDTRPR